MSKLQVNKSTGDISLEKEAVHRGVLCCFSSAARRVCILLTWLTLVACGLVWGLKFTRATKTEVRPAIGTKARLAETLYNAHFPEEDQTIMVVITAKAPRSPLLNLTTRECRDDFQRFSQAFDRGVAKMGQAGGELDGCKPRAKGYCTMSPLLQQTVGARLFGEDYSLALIQLSTASSCNSRVLSDAVNHLVAPFTAGQLDIQPTGGPLLLVEVQDGIKTTMDISTKTFPFALVLVSAVVRNIRTAICIVLSIVCTLLTSFLVMYPLALHINVTSMTPSLMIAAILAMSIDYSLFLLSRFRDEIDRGMCVPDAVATMLQTSGHIVVVSGLTLAVCFLTMLLLPSEFIATMGVGASVSVLLAIVANLTITPTLLLSFPNFFSSSRRFGLTTDGCCCGNKPAHAHNKPAHSSKQQDELYRHFLSSDSSTGPSQYATDTFPRSCYFKLARATQSWGLVVLAAVVATSVPFIWHVPAISYSEGVEDLMPRQTPGTLALDQIEADFGADLVFATTLLMAPPAGTPVTDPAWLTQACHAIEVISNGTAGSSLSMYQGAMVWGGKCLTGELVGPALELALDSGALEEYVPRFCEVVADGDCLPDCSAIIGKYSASCPLVCQLLNQTLSNNTTQCKSELDTTILAVRSLALSLISADTAVATVTVHLKGNPFNAAGQDFIKAFRVQADKFTSTHSSSSSVGDMFLWGQGPVQMDTATAVFDKFPLMMSVTVAIVFALIGIAFKSLVVPLRAVLCLTLMLGVTFGLAIMTYQDGFLDFLHFPSVSRSHSRALYWMSPMIAFSVMVGLGLDYDVFLMESVMEARKSGLCDSEAVMSGLCATANIISVAGVVMLVAFSSLLFSATEALNQIAFLLLVGLIVDCFITTKLIIPAAMGVLGSWNFWPKRYPVTRSVLNPEKHLVSA